MTQLMSHKCPNIPWSIIQCALKSKSERSLISGGVIFQVSQELFKQCFLSFLVTISVSAFIILLKIIICVHRGSKLPPHIWRVN